MDVEKLIKKEVVRLKKSSLVVAVFLFGSHARKATHERSDIDICVIAKKLSPTEEAELCATPVEGLDIVLFDRLPLPIRFRVFAEGKPLFIRDESFVARIKFLTIKHYLDMLPVLERMYAATLAP